MQREVRGRMEGLRKEKNATKRRERKERESALSSRSRIQRSNSFSLLGWNTGWYCHGAEREFGTH